MNSEKIWIERINAWRASGQALNLYCRSNQIGLSGMYYWRKKLGQIDSKLHGFIPVRPVQSHDAGDFFSITIDGKLQVKINLRVGFRWP